MSYYVAPSLATIFVGRANSMDHEEGYNMHDYLFKPPACQQVL